MLRVAINGYGRIGRLVHRQFLQYFPDVEVVAINASSDAEMRAYLLKYDSLHGRFSGEVSVTSEDELLVLGKPVRVIKQRDPGKCPWKELRVDIVVESSGTLETREQVESHLSAGAIRVIVTAPMKDKTPTYVKGVNDHGLTADQNIISCASCTTNCIAPVIKVFDDAYAVEHLLVCSVHAYTVSQNLLDNKPKEDGELRRARAATLSLIPTKTGAVKSCAHIFPHLKGKMDGMAFRVPVPTVSCAYMAFSLGRETTVEDIHAKIEAASKSKDLRGILSISYDQCVSIDFQTDPHSSIVDAPSTKVIDGTFAQVLSWYDNEWGYAMRVTEMTVKMGELLTARR